MKEKKIVLRRCNCGFLFQEEEEVLELGIPRSPKSLKMQTVVLARKPANTKQLTALPFLFLGQPGFIYTCPRCREWLYVQKE